MPGTIALISSTTPLEKPVTVLHEDRVKFKDKNKVIKTILIINLEYSFQRYCSHCQHIKFPL